MAITMSVGFGFGIVLMSVIQDLPTGTQAGLESIIYGKAASMIRADAIGIGIASIAVVLCSTVLFKEFRLLCFDEAFATSQGWSVTTLDILLLLLGTAVTVIGLQAVGLMLVLAMLIIPAAAARYWTDSLLFMMLIAAGLGALGSWIGVTISALVPNMPAGAVIVLSGAALFILSLVLGRRGGLLVRGIQSIRTHRRVHRQHVLRAIFESESTASQGLIAIDDIVARRTWSRRQVRRLLARAMSRGEVQTRAHKVRLTQTGRDAAEAIVRNHRLWEIYLIEHADIAPTHVDRDADAIEHVLGVDLVRELEQILLRGGSLPGSPHPLGSSGSSSGSSGGAPA
jgi:manganese/zinc/iron transport system permease protein